ncbi:MAG: hypothetical protein EXS13_14590, partial [Planctomycetes bacterium]|nr:hypothetical protein [Planctomycetota bacterium]
MPAAAQTNITSYYVNDGKSDSYDFSTGEMAIDTGGFVPFDRYTDTTPGSGHYIARIYTPPAGSGFPATFHQLMKESLLDLAGLDSILKQSLYPPGVLPSTTS